MNRILFEPSELCAPDGRVRLPALFATVDPAR